MKLSYRLSLDERIQSDKDASNVLLKRTKIGPISIWLYMRIIPVSFLAVPVVKLAGLDGDPWTLDSASLFKAAPFLALTGLVGFFFLQSKKQVRECRERFGPGPFDVEVVADEVTFAHRLDDQEGRYSWGSVNWLEDSKTGIAVAFKPAGHVWIPNSAFADDAERMAWKTFIEARIDDAKKLTD